MKMYVNVLSTGVSNPAPGGATVHSGPSGLSLDTPGLLSAPHTKKTIGLYHNGVFSTLLMQKTDTRH